MYSDMIYRGKKRSFHMVVEYRKERIHKVTN